MVDSAYTYIGSISHSPYFPSDDLLTLFQVLSRAQPVDRGDEEANATLLPASV